MSQVVLNYRSLLDEREAQINTFFSNFCKDQLTRITKSHTKEHTARRKQAALAFVRDLQNLLATETAQTTQEQEEVPPVEAPVVQIQPQPPIMVDQEIEAQPQMQEFQCGSQPAIIEEEKASEEELVKFVMVDEALSPIPQIPTPSGTTDNSKKPKSILKVPVCQYQLHEEPKKSKARTYEQFQQEQVDSTNEQNQQPLLSQKSKRVKFGVDVDEEEERRERQKIILNQQNIFTDDIPVEQAEEEKQQEEVQVQEEEQDQTEVEESKEAQSKSKYDMSTISETMQKIRRISKNRTDLAQTPVFPEPTIPQDLEQMARAYQSFQNGGERLTMSPMKFPPTPFKKEQDQTILVNQEEMNGMRYSFQDPIVNQEEDEHPTTENQLDSYLEQPQVEVEVLPAESYEEQPIMDVTFGAQPSNSLSQSQITSNSNKENIPPPQQPSEDYENIKEGIESLKIEDEIDQERDDESSDLNGYIIPLQPRDPNFCFFQPEQYVHYQMQDDQEDSLPQQEMGEELTPLVYQEFVQCNSEYFLSDKEDSDAISSDEEFIDARNPVILNEEDSYINKIEQENNAGTFNHRVLYKEIHQKLAAQKNGHQTQKLKVIPQLESNFNLQQSHSQHEDGAVSKKTSRYQGMKFFNKVGYTQSLRKNIPRWAADSKLLDKIVFYQKKNLNGDQVFGKMDPRKLEFDLKVVFEEEFTQIKSQKQFRKYNKYTRRGSSEYWNDAHEFATPDLVKKNTQMNANVIGNVMVNPYRNNGQEFDKQQNKNPLDQDSGYFSFCEYERNMFGITPADQSMNDQVNLDKTLSFTQSSFAYKDPYNPNGPILNKLKNKVWTFFSLRNIENEFIDFKTFHINNQFREIYSDLYNAYKRNDKVILQRSLSEGMFEYVNALLKEKRPNPFYKTIKSLHLVQARTYAETDHLLPEEQWAQLTVKFNLQENDTDKIVQYNVFERRLADKLSYLDWKLSYTIDEQDFKFLHGKGDDISSKSQSL